MTLNNGLSTAMSYIEPHPPEVSVTWTAEACKEVLKISYTYIGMQD